MKLLVTILALSLTTAFVSSAPTEDPSSGTSSPAAPAAAGANIIDAHAHLANSSFTCFNRQIGYYADTDADCKVYHFCMLGDYNGQEVYQRVSYMCINETVFDQKALDCVEASNMTTPCDQSAKFYDESNAALRKAIIVQANMESEKKGEEKKEGEERKEGEEKMKKKDEDDEEKHNEEDEKKKDDDDKKDGDRREDEKKEG